MDIKSSIKESKRYWASEFKSLPPLLTLYFLIVGALTCLIVYALIIHTVRVLIGVGIILGFVIIGYAVSFAAKVVMNLFKKDQKES